MAPPQPLWSVVVSSSSRSNFGGGIAGRSRRSAKDSRDKMEGEDDFAAGSSYDLDEVRLARQRLSSMMEDSSGSTSGTLPFPSRASPVATTAEGGALDAGQCVDAALQSGELELVVDVDVPFLDRLQPRLYDNQRAGDLALEMAKRVARRSEAREANAPSESVRQRRLTKVFFPNEATAAEAQRSWASDRLAQRLGIVALGFEEGDGSAGLTGEAAGLAPSPHAALSVDSIGTMGKRMEKLLRRSARIDGGGDDDDNSDDNDNDCGYIVVCPASRVDMVGTRYVARAGQEGRVPVVVINPRFEDSSMAGDGRGTTSVGWPRELSSFECAFGLAPFRVQAKRNDPKSPMGANRNNPLDSPSPDDPNIFRPSVVLMKRYGRPWQLFVDDGLKPKRFGPNYAFCGGFGPAGGTGGGPRRPPLQIVLPAVMEFLSRVSTKNAADAAATDSLAARMAAKEIADDEMARKRRQEEGEEEQRLSENGERDARGAVASDSNGDEDFEDAVASVDYLNRIFSLDVSSADCGDTASIIGSNDKENVEFLNRIFEKPAATEEESDG